MNPIEIVAGDLINLNNKAVAHINPGIKKPGLNGLTQVIISNSGKQFPTLNSVIESITGPTSKRAWHVIVGREERQIIQVGSFRDVLPHTNSLDVVSSVGIVLFNYGRLHCIKNVYYNAFKQVEHDIFIEQGNAWHAYTKYQINTVYNVVKALKTTYNINQVSAYNKPTGGHNPTPQFPFNLLN